MSATYNLKNKQDYDDFYNMVIESLEEENDKDTFGYPITDEGERIDVDYLWDEFGHQLDGKQTGLGHQVFSEIIDYYQPITEERRDEIKEMARQDFLDAYECGQVNEDDCDPEQLREMGLTTKQEQETYTKVYEELMYK